MATFNLKKGDTSPDLKFFLQDGDGNSIGIANFNEVRFLMRGRRSTTLVVDEDTSGNVTVTDPENGEVRYEWKSQDTETAGRFYAEFEVEYSDGNIETFPNTDYIFINIEEEL